MRKLQSFADLRYYLRADLCRYGEGVSRNAFRQAYRFVPGFRFTVWLRLTMFLAAQPVWTRPLYRLSMRHFRRLRIRYGFDIESGTQIGPGLHLRHWGGVVVHPSVVIGENCNLSQQITIGVDSKEGAAAPVLGDRVYVAPGSRVFGGVTVGFGSSFGFGGGFSTFGGGGGMSGGRSSTFCGSGGRSSTGSGSDVLDDGASAAAPASGESPRGRSASPTFITITGGSKNSVSEE